MGHYLNPPAKVLEVGKRASLTDAVPAGHVLVGHYDRGFFKQAAILYDASEVEEFEAQHRSGAIKALGYYHVPFAAAQELGAHMPESMNTAA